jgi:hypothetical protein
MNKSIIAGVVGVLLIAAGAFYFFGFGKIEIVVADTVIEGDYAPGNLVLKDGATLTVNGDLTVKGTLSCDGGPLKVVVNGGMKVTGTLECKGAEAAGIALVVSGSVALGDSARVKADGSVQIVNDATKLLTTDEQIEAAYIEAGAATGAGPRFGPFVDDGSVSVSPAPAEETSALPRFVNVAYAQDAMDKDGNIVESGVIGGNWVVGDGGAPPSGLAIDTPNKKIKRIIINFNFGQNGNVQLNDFHLVGPAGRDGKSDEGNSCNAKGEDGENAMRFRVVAKNVEVNNFRIELGNGGAGGTAETTKDCDPGIAKGGKGGEAGNMKMTAENGITINSMTIVPGTGGNGGGATAYGKDGVNACPGTKGGDATATAGDGGKNKKELSAVGAVSGIGNITLNEVMGGFAGSAFAYPGKGGDGTGCNCNGGAGGKATATGGKGGDASVEAGGAVAASGATGGDGGDAEAKGGNGGNGGQCPLKPKGGDGGKGGDAVAKEGKGGTGDPTNGDPGTVKEEKGGDGGNGGDGCGPGAGGKGGVAREPGVDGKPGKLVCPVEEKKTSTSVTPPAGSTVTTPKPIQVIRYQDKYLPVSQLIIEDEVGCGAEHWHAAEGVVVATDGSQVFDPGPQCGFGKVSQLPAMPYTPQ